MFRVIVTKGRRLKKVSGDLEVHKQNVVPLEPRVDESNNTCG
jgi:hypothetical protein